MMATQNVLIIDTETTGLDARKGAQVIEIGAVLFNVPHRAILQSFATLIPCSDNPVESINHISAGMTQCSYPFKQVSGVMFDWIICAMSQNADACVAHNADFDRRFIGTMEWGSQLLEKPWICTKKNFTWPVSPGRFRLQDICTAMGIPYANAHRALNDCLLIAQCFQKVSDLGMRIERCLPLANDLPKSA